MRKNRRFSSPRYNPKNKLVLYNKSEVFCKCSWMVNCLLNFCRCYGQIITLVNFWIGLELGAIKTGVNYFLKGKIRRCDNLRPRKNWQISIIQVIWFFENCQNSSIDKFSSLKKTVNSLDIIFEQQNLLILRSLPQRSFWKAKITWLILSYLVLQASP